MSDKKPLEIKEKTNVFKTFPGAYEMLRSYFSKEYTTVPLATLIGMFAVIGYLILPADIVPDIIPIAGLVDDASILAIVLMLVQSDLDKFRAWKINQEEEEKEVTEDDRKQ